MIYGSRPSSPPLFTAVYKSVALSKVQPTRGGGAWLQISYPREFESEGARKERTEDDRTVWKVTARAIDPSMNTLRSIDPLQRLISPAELAERCAGDDAAGLLRWRMTKAKVERGR